MKKVKALFFTAVMILTVALPSYALAGTPDLTKSLDVAGKAGFGTTVGEAQGQLGPLIADIIAVILGFVGTIAFIIFLMGGFLWLTARGNDEQVKKARMYMTNALIGIVVIILAYSITFYVSEVVFQAAGGRT